MPRRPRTESGQLVRAQPADRVLSAAARPAARGRGVRNVFAVASARQARRGESLVRAAGEVTVSEIRDVQAKPQTAKPTCALRLSSTRWKGSPSVTARWHLSVRFARGEHKCDRATARYQIDDKTGARSHVRELSST